MIVTAQIEFKMKVGPSVLLLSPAVVAELVLFTDALQVFVAFAGRLSRESNGGGSGSGSGGGVSVPPPPAVGHTHSSSGRRVGAGAGAGSAAGTGVGGGGGFELGERDVRCGTRARPATLDVSVHANLEFLQPTLVLLHSDRPRRLLPSALPSALAPTAAHRSSAHSGTGVRVGAAGSSPASLGARTGTGTGTGGVGGARGAGGSGSEELHADGDWQSLFAQLGAALVRDFPQLERCTSPSTTLSSSPASLSGPDTLTADSGSASIEANTNTQINFKHLQRRITEHLSVLVPFDQLRHVFY